MKLNEIEMIFFCDKAITKGKCKKLEAKNSMNIWDTGLIILFLIDELHFFFALAVTYRNNIPSYFC